MGTHNLILLFIHVVLFMAPGILSAGRRDVDESINQHGDPHHPELFAAEFGCVYIFSLIYIYTYIYVVVVINSYLYM